MLKTDTLRYAQDRANDTRSNYIITGMGHALWDCPSNRALANECMDGVLLVVKPKIA